MKVIGLVGPIASGKGTVLKILHEKGYSVYSTSDRVREELGKRGIELSRQNLKDVANEMRKNLGGDILAVQTANSIEQDDPDLAVIDAIRNPSEINFLKQKFGIKIIGVVADQAKRFEMFKNRGANTTGITTWEEFKQLDDAETQQEGEFKQQVNESLKLADVIIENNETVEELKKKVEKVISDN